MNDEDAQLMRKLIPHYLFYKNHMEKEIMSDEDDLESLSQHKLGNILSTKSKEKITLNFETTRDKFEKLIKQYQDYSSPKILEESVPELIYQQLQVAKLNKEQLELMNEELGKIIKELKLQKKKLDLTDYEEKSEFKSFIYQYECIQDQHKKKSTEIAEEIKKLKEKYERESNTGTPSYELRQEKLKEMIELVKIPERSIKEFYKLPSD